MAEDFGRFKDSLTRLARVPKAEIDEQAKREAQSKDNRRIRSKPAAKHGHIVPTIEPR